MRIKRILAGLGVAAAALALTACSGGGAATGTTDAGVSQAAATVSTSDTPAAKPTTPSTSDASSKKAEPQMAAGVPCAITAKACVDLSAHKAWLLDDGKIVYGPVSTMPGKKGSTTPLGTWHVLYKEKMHLSKEFDNAPMPNSVFFYPGVAFHQGSLARFSNGCVHLSQTSSEKFFDALQKGDEVQVVR